MLFKLIQKLKRPTPGFSLIEMMAVLVIVSLGLIGVASLATQSIQAQTINRGNIIAYQLAQEGIEIVRQKRDTNWLQALDWKDGIGTGTYCVDYFKPDLRVVASPSECQLRLDADKWYRSPFVLSTVSAATPFFRSVTIEAATSSMSVRAVVTWMDRSRAHRFEAETELYDWR
ncbi:MAG: type II secretion system protein [bacterium]|nr:type II secretion system protein [bacterium]